MDKHKFKAILLETIGQELKIPLAQLEQNGLQNLHMDSMDVVQITCALEDKLNINITDDVFMMFDKPDSVLDNLWQYMTNNGYAR